MHARLTIFALTPKQACASGALAANAAAMAVAYAVLGVLMVQVRAGGRIVTRLDLAT